eukprot:12225178-Alexandrium_andersonii.AAC.1
MENKRGWKPERSHAEWTRMEAMPKSKIERDMYGPEHSKLRLYVPSNLMGLGKVHKRHLEEEAKEAE